MQRVAGVALVALLGASGCYRSHLLDDDDAGARMDAPVIDSGDATCGAGSACDCRAALPVPAGTFWVGWGNPGAPYPESPARQVTITRDYWMGTYEVTAGCYARCIDDGTCAPPEVEPFIPMREGWDLPPAYWDVPAFAHRPISFVDYPNANAYCAWLGGRLPTSAEWEKMTRGEDGRGYPWDSAPANPRDPYPRGRSPRPDFARAHDPQEPRERVTMLLEVGSLPLGRGPYGHFEVIGNVNEWVVDWLAIPFWGPEGALVDPRNDVPSEFGHMARSEFGPGWRASSPEYNGFWGAAGIRCAFDAAPEPLLVE